MSVIESAKSVVQVAASDPRTAVGVGGGTGVSGVGVMLDWLPSSAEIAALCGALLSLVLAWNHWKNGRLHRKKEQAELELLKLQIAEHRPHEGEK